MSKKKLNKNVLLQEREKEFIENILLDFVDCHTDKNGIVPKDYEEDEIVEEVIICRQLLHKINAIVI